MFRLNKSDAIRVGPKIYSRYAGPSLQQSLNLSLQSLINSLVNLNSSLQSLYLSLHSLNISLQSLKISLQSLNIAIYFMTETDRTHV